jgi:branched-chain amino acid transport system permease protein
VLAQQLINGVMLGSVYAMVAVGLTLSIGVLNFLNFSIPGIFMLGGMMTWMLIQAGFSWPLAMLGALALAVVASLIVERFTWRQMRGAEPFVPLVSSMAFLLLFEHLAIFYWGSEMHVVPIRFSGADYRLGHLVVSIPQLAGLSCSILLVAALSLLLKRTRFGRALRTIAESSDTALMLGVDVNRFAPAVFVVAGLFTAFAGVLFALNYRQVQPFMGEAVGLKGISAMIVGGMGNIWGSIIGGLIIGIAEVSAIGWFGADFVDIVVFGLLLLILFVRPTGLFRGMQPARSGI